MKKIILFLVSISILFSTCTVFAETMYTDLTPDDDCYKHVKRLTDFGFISGYEDGTYKPERYVTRAETAKLMCVALNEQGGKGNLEFTDVPDEHWAYDFICSLAAKRLIEGYDDGTFRPDDTITYSEFLKILVSTIGYGDYADQTGGYPAGYMATAMMLNLVIDGMATDHIVTREHAAILYDKMLDTPIRIATGFTADYATGLLMPVYEVQDGEGQGYQTLLTWCHDIYTVSGTLGDGNDTTAQEEQPINREYVIYNGEKVEDIVFSDKEIVPYPSFVNLPTKYKSKTEVNNVVPLSKADSSITIVFEEAETDDLYISVFDVTAQDYVTGRVGVRITSKEHTISKLKGGHEYLIKVSSTKTNRKVSGKIIVGN